MNDDCSPYVYIYISQSQRHVPFKSTNLHKYENRDGGKKHEMLLEARGC